MESLRWKFIAPEKLFIKRNRSCFDILECSPSRSAEKTHDPRRLPILILLATICPSRYWFWERRTFSSLHHALEHLENSLKVSTCSKIHAGKLVKSLLWHGTLVHIFWKHSVIVQSVSQRTWRNSSSLSNLNLNIWQWTHGQPRNMQIQHLSFLSVKMNRILGSDHNRISLSFFIDETAS